MNDYWNDPPEYPEPPECCGDIMDVTEDGACVCPTCKKRIEPQQDPDPRAFADAELPDDITAEECLLGGGGAELVAKDLCDSPKSPNESILMQ